MIVLDASALLVLLHEERGADEAARAITSEGEPVIGTVNLAEVLSKLTEVGADPADVLRPVTRVVRSIRPFNTRLALETARLRSLTARAGLSLGDRACLSLARTLRAPVLTADRSWSDFSDQLGVEVRLIR